jgi:hypothetical protein
MLPAKVEDQSLTEVLASALANRETSSYATLMRTLFVDQVRK